MNEEKIVCDALVRRSMEIAALRQSSPDSERKQMATASQSSAYQTQK